MSQYGKVEYWEERYTKYLPYIIIIILKSDPDPFDWYQRFSGIKDTITSNFSPESVILNVGAGNSSKIKG